MGDFTLFDFRSAQREGFESTLPFYLCTTQSFCIFVYVFLQFLTAPLFLFFPWCVVSYHFLIFKCIINSLFTFFGFLLFYLITLCTF